MIGTCFVGLVGLWSGLQRPLMYRCRYRCTGGGGGGGGQGQGAGGACGLRPPGAASAKLFEAGDRKTAYYAPVWMESCEKDMGWNCKGIRFKTVQGGGGAVGGALPLLPDKDPSGYVAAVAGHAVCHTVLHSRRKSHTPLSRGAYTPVADDDKHWM